MNWIKRIGIVIPLVLGAWVMAERYADKGDGIRVEATNTPQVYTFTNQGEATASDRFYVHGLSVVNKGESSVIILRNCTTADLVAAKAAGKGILLEATENNVFSMSPLPGVSHRIYNVGYISVTTDATNDLIIAGW